MSSGAAVGSSGRGGTLRLAASIAAIGVVSLVVWYRAKRNKRKQRRAQRKRQKQQREFLARQQQQHQRYGSSSYASASPKLSSSRSPHSDPKHRPPTRTILINTGDPAALDGLFEQAAQKSHQVKNLMNGDKLMLYGLYKQALVGDAVLNQLEPSHFHIVAHAKYHAWKKFAGMRPLEAKMNYIQAVQELEMGATRSTASSTSELSFDDDEYNDDDDDGLDAAFGTAIGFGHKQSTLAHNQYSDDEEDDDDDDEDPNDMSPEAQLRRAARQGDAWRIEKVMRAFPKLDPNSSDASGQTALHFCADQGNVPAVQLLLELGANPNAVDEDGISVLQVAVISDKVPVAKVLLAAGALPDQTDCDGDSPRSCVDESNCYAMKQLFHNTLPVFEGTAA